MTIKSPYIDLTCWCFVLSSMSAWIIYVKYKWTNGHHVAPFTKFEMQITFDSLLLRDVRKCLINYWVISFGNVSCANVDIFSEWDAILSSHLRAYERAFSPNLNEFECEFESILNECILLPNSKLLFSFPSRFRVSYLLSSRGLRCRHWASVMTPALINSAVRLYKMYDVCNPLATLQAFWKNLPVKNGLDFFFAFLNV